MMKIYGRRNSAATQKVLWLCAEAGIPYELEWFGMGYTSVDSPEYVAINPNRRVPAIDDEGYVLWESNVICRYLADKHNLEVLWPRDPCARAEADRWMEWQSSNWMLIVPAFAFLVRGITTFGGDSGVQPALDRAAEAYRIIEDHLAGRSFVAGDHLTLGDFALMPRVHQWFGLGRGRPAMPNLDSWYRRLSAMPSFRETFTLPLT